MLRSKSNVIRLRHMVDACQKALRFTRGKLRKDLDDDEQLTLALVRLIEILGEAAAKVTPDVQARYTSIPWKEIIGTRNRFARCGSETVRVCNVWVLYI